MYTESAVDKYGFKPFKIVIETQEEVEHLLYKLCFSHCVSDPRGIEVKMSDLIAQEMKDQKIDISGYLNREEHLKMNIDKYTEPDKCKCGQPIE